jgi:hypothetical protein
MANKKFDAYTREELEAIRTVLLEQVEILDRELKSDAYLAVIKDAMENEVEMKMDVVGKINARLKMLVSKCIFCKEVAEVEVPTLTHICGKCDRRIFGGLS